jgi:BASS family bile acid:Na+ symporter
VAIESGFQNGTVGIAVGALLAAAQSAAATTPDALGAPGTASAELAGSTLSPFSLPSGVYGVLMMVTILPYLAWRRSLQPEPRGQRN